MSAVLSVQAREGSCGESAAVEPPALGAKPSLNAGCFGIHRRDVPSTRLRRAKLEAEIFSNAPATFSQIIAFATAGEWRLMPLMAVVDLAA
ncbi:hypothetical protein [Paraburkholderia unamae]|uniref:Uncharacterized protein n=1 Tax=Paraburkholderia unamae TaxID=219649 RepID=A0ACC6RR14_9BURK